MKKEIKDSANYTIGNTEVSGTKTYIYDSGGTVLGVYRSDEDKTYNSGNTYIGRGNQLFMLLPRK